MSNDFGWSLQSNYGHLYSDQAMEHYLWEY